MNSRNSDGASDALVVDEIAAGLADQPGALMLVLHAVNERLGYIPPDAIPAIAHAKHIQARLGIDFGQTSANGDFTLEPVYCLGNCACSPAIIVGDDLYGRVSPQRFDEIFSEITSPEPTR